MPKLVVKNMTHINDPFLGKGEHVNCPNEGDLAKAIGEHIHDALFASLLEQYLT
jgi:hypothetical protein